MCSNATYDKLVERLMSAHTPQKDLQSIINGLMQWIPVIRTFSSDDVPITGSFVLYNLIQL